MSTADQNPPLPDGGPGSHANEGEHWDVAHAHDPEHPVGRTSEHEEQDVTDREQEDPVAEDIAERRPETDDIVAGEQVLDGDVETAQRPIAPHPDDFRGEGAAPKHRQSTHDPLQRSWPPNAG